MSWWIVDFKSINENGTEGLCDIECDTAASLPAADQTLTAGIKIVRGSKAMDLSTGDRYKLNSSGSWVQQPSEYSLDLTGYATQSWVNGELAGYVPTTTYNTDQAAQDAAIAGKASVSTFNITLSTQITASEYSHSCIQTGDIVTVCFRIVLAAGLNAATSYSLFQLPSGTYPRITVAGTGYADSKVCTFWLNTSGQIRFTTGSDAIPSGASINANFCYSYKSSNWSTITP